MTISKDTLFEDHKDRLWKTPRDYAGHNPVGELVVAMRTRDSGLGEDYTYRVARENLFRKSTELGLPDEESVYDWRARHWAFGWVEYLMLKPTAPADLLLMSSEILGEVADNGVLDYEGYYEEVRDLAEQQLAEMDEEEILEIKKELRSAHPGYDESENDLVIDHIIEFYITE